MKDRTEKFSDLELSQVRNQQFKQFITTGLNPLTAKCNCANCKKENLLIETYRCLYCRLYFCASCAEIHFGTTRKEWIARKEIEKVEEIVELLITFTTTALIRYLLSKGWKFVGEYPEKAYVFQKENISVLVPVLEKFADYHACLWETIKKVSDYENRNYTSLVSDLQDLT